MSGARQAGSDAVTLLMLCRRVLGCFVLSPSDDFGAWHSDEYGKFRVDISHLSFVALCWSSAFVVGPFSPALCWRRGRCLIFCHGASLGAHGNRKSARIIGTSD